MHMRMPDRLVFDVDLPVALHGRHLPSMALLTLVENAVRHGIDPSEEGGRIEVGARRGSGSDRLQLWVTDSGRGIDDGHAPGTGLSNLRQRLHATYGDRASLSLSAVEPHGVHAQVELPAAA